MMLLVVLLLLTMTAPTLVLLLLPHGNRSTAIIILTPISPICLSHAQPARLEVPGWNGGVVTSIIHQLGNVAATTSAICAGVLPVVAKEAGPLHPRACRPFINITPAGDPQDNCDVVVRQKRCLEAHANKTAEADHSNTQCTGR